MAGLQLASTKCIAFTAMCIALAGCTSANPSTSQHTPLTSATLQITDETAHSVGLETALAQERKLNLTRTLPGKIEPDVGKEVDISSRVAGRIDRLLVAPAQHVAKGQILAVLTSREISELEAQAIEVSARAETARVQEEREKIVFQEQVHYPQTLIDARATLREAETHLRLMQSQLSRQQTLFREQIGAQKDLAAAEAAFDQAESDVQQAKLNVAREETFFQNKALLRAPLQKAEAEHTHAQKELDALVSQLAFLGVDTTNLKAQLRSGTVTGVLKVVAPITGVLSFFDIAEGELVQADRPIFRISDLSTVLVSADVPESEIQQVSNGSLLQVTVPGSKKSVTAKIAFEGNHVDPATRTLPVRARIENKSGLFKPGMFANVQLVQQTPPALTVPKDAVQDANGTKVVYVKTPGGFDQRTVSVGHTDDNFVEITAGLKDGETVVTRGSLMLKTQLSYTQKEQP